MAVSIRSTDQLDESVQLDGSDVVIVALRVNDPDVFAIVEASTDPGDAVEMCLTLGARVLRA